VEVRLSNKEVAQALGAEAADIVGLFGDQESSKTAHVSLDRELIDLKRSATLSQNSQRLVGERNEIGFVRRHADIVKLEIGEQRLRRIPSVARHAAAVAIES
jgi:hypothetical protein